MENYRQKLRRRPGPVWARYQISERAAVEEGIAEGAGSDQRDDRPSSELHPDTATDQQARIGNWKAGGTTFRWDTRATRTGISTGILAIGWQIT